MVGCIHPVSGLLMTAGFTAGDPVPWFTLPATTGRNFNFSSLAGRYVALLFLGASRVPACQAVLDRVAQRRDLFSDHHCCFFGVSTDPADRDQRLLSQTLPGIYCFWDVGGHISRRYGALVGEGTAIQLRPHWLILDPQLRVLTSFMIKDTDAALSFIGGLPPVECHAGTQVTAPILILPRIFERDFCRRLIDAYEAGTPQDSGFMRDVDGKTVGMIDHKFKRRRDVEIDGELREAAKHRIEQRLLPELVKAFQFNATRMERYLVACYRGVDQGFFGAHRDNTTRGTAHRRFAVTINLNAEEFEGGELRLPEFGPQTYRAPTGGAVVFSCSLLHEAMPVTKGNRYAFLPFLYDEAAAAVRERNLQYLQTAS